MMKRSQKQLLDMERLLLLIAFTVKHILKQKQQRIPSIPYERRDKWSTMLNRINDIQFNRMQSMSKDCFQLLCEKIKNAVGEEELKYKAYCDKINNTSRSPYLQAHKKRDNGIICGEMKVAITLRLFAGASYIDLQQLYSVSYQHIYMQYPNLCSG